MSDLMKGLEAKIFLTFFIAVTFIVSLFIPGDFLVGFGLWLALMIYLSFFTEQLFIYVPTVTGMIMHNTLTGNMRGIGPGFNVKLPWEKIDKKVDISVRRGGFSKTYNSGGGERGLETEGSEEAPDEGVDQKADVSYVWQPDIENLPTFISIDNSVIERGVEDAVSSCLSEIMASNSAEWNRNNINAISRQLRDDFENLNVQNLDIEVDERTEEEKSREHGIETAFGINVLLTQVADISYPEEYRKAVMQKVIAKNNSLAAKEYQIDETVSGKDALNFVQVQQDKSNKTIYDVEGLEEFGKHISEGIATAVSKIFGGK